MDGFCVRLRKYRKEINKTQEELAKDVGMSRTGYADLEKEGSGKVFEKLPALAKSLGCRIDDLFSEMDAVKTDSAVGFENESLDDFEM